MPAITASMVAALRAKTDAPMMECKKALTEADGDSDRAEEILRVKLGNKAGKAASRIARERSSPRAVQEKLAFAFQHAQEHAAIERELQMAHQIQRQLVPKRRDFRVLSEFFLNDALFRLPHLYPVTD